jgi:hypothetical protein
VEETFSCIWLDAKVGSGFVVGWCRFLSTPSRHVPGTKKYVDDAVADVEVGPPGTTSFNEITDKPTWVGKFSYDDIGQYMDPVQPSNFDIVMHDSLTPSADSAYNLGHDLRRFLFGCF